jgi:hypothetical protein
VVAKTSAVATATAAVPAKPGQPGAKSTAAPGTAVTAAVTAPATAADKAADNLAAEASEAEASAKNLEEMKSKFKPAKKAMAIPTELLGDAKSYDDKLILVKLLTEKEQSRVVLMVKNMLRSNNAVKK